MPICQGPVIVYPTSTSTQVYLIMEAVHAQKFVTSLALVKSLCSILPKSLDLGFEKVCSMLAPMLDHAQ